ADVRAPTPSAAAELVAPDRAEVARAVNALRTRGEVRLTRQLVAAREALDSRAQALVGALPDTAAHRALLGERATTIVRLAGERLARSREDTAAIAGRLAGLSPAATLERGYAVVERPDGTIVTAVAALADGDRVALRLRDGRRAARIEPNGAGS
ncbi:MAG: exodeoxyribonuclease VII large subunit, partial [Dehalococcoidia bacterium]|nr:exodeoxyribonuclease VII large subunit [Dehalococcoidia bacterium]